jgi:hypothetical protein
VYKQKKNVPTLTKTKPKQQIKPTQRHKRLAAEVIENTTRTKPLTRKQLLTLSGYSASTADATPSKPFTSQGFQVALREAGATEDKMARVVNEAMDANAGAWFKGEYHESTSADHAIRLRAADQLAELTGAKITKIQVQSVNVNLDASDLAAMMGL